MTEKGEKARIYSWRFGAVILPWATIIGMFLVVFTNYVKMKETTEEFPKIVEKVVNNSQDLVVLKRVVSSMEENMRETNSKLDAINQNLLRFFARRER